MTKCDQFVTSEGNIARQTRTKIICVEYYKIIADRKKTMEGHGIVQCIRRSDDTRTNVPVGGLRSNTRGPLHKLMSAGYAEPILNTQ